MRGSLGCALLGVAALVAGPGCSGDGKPKGVVADPGPPTLAAVVADYGKAWNEPDAGARLALLEKSFAADGAYTDPGPNDVAADRAGLVAVIGQFQSLFPGATIEQASGIDAVYGHFRFAWRVRQAGAVILTGEDEGRYGSDGLIMRITGFFDGSSTTTTPPAAQSTLFKALNDATSVERATDLAAAVGSAVSWTDRWGIAGSEATLETHLDDWVAPGTGTFLPSPSTDLYAGFFRVNLTLTTGSQVKEAQLFGHVGADGLIEWASYLDGPLPALSAADAGW